MVNINFISLSSIFKVQLSRQQLGWQVEAVCAITLPRNLPYRLPSRVIQLHLTLDLKMFYTQGSTYVYAAYDTWLESGISSQFLHSFEKLMVNSEYAGFVILRKPALLHH